MKTRLSAGLCAGLCAVLLSGTALAAPDTSLVPPKDNQKLAHDIFRDLVEVRSVHDIGTKQTADILVKYFKAHGFTDKEIQVLPEPKYPHQVNVVVTLKGKTNAAPVMWMGHMDVVDAKRDDWTTDPYKFIEKDGYYYGRGTSDMKDEDAAVAASLIRLKKEGYVPDRDIIAAFTADEEVGYEQDGPAFLMREHRATVNPGLIINPDGGSGEILNGKRTGFGVQTSEKIYATYTMETTNKGGHSSEPRPDNAIYELSNALVRLSKYSFPFVTNATTRLYFKQAAASETGQKKTDLLALAASPKVNEAAAKRLSKDVALNAILHTTCTATMLKAGVQENALPSRATATVQCRIMPSEKLADIKAQLEKIAGDPKIKLTLISDTTLAPESPPTPAFLASVSKVVHGMWPGVPVFPAMSAGASDSIFTRNAGIPSYGVGGGWNDLHDVRAHGRDERMKISTFYQTVEFTYRLMKELGQASAPIPAAATVTAKAPAK
ncbi:MAG TPA: M20/M25/M40 family metallo-hydrolase [Rhizomicrobium sp.]|nr:M20/M25/M40 family metallo-hydrolase [Rhizomicrobium sp.]